MADILAPGQSPKPTGPHRFAKGNPGRPKGARGKGAVAIRKAIEKAFEEDAPNGEGNKLEAAIKKQVDAAVNGDLQALVVLLAYYGGKPRQMEPENEDTQVNNAIALLQALRESERSGFRPNADMVGKASTEDQS